MERKALGKGLGALLPDRQTPATETSGEIQQIALTQIIPNRNQPRSEFGDGDLKELAASLKQNGVLQPILVRRIGDGAYELIAGERRVRAAKLAGLTKIPAIVRVSSDRESMEFALVENIQRKDLNPMEAARAYHRLTTEFGLTQEEVAKRVGKDRSSVANIARLLHLAPEVQDLVESGQLSIGHAKVVLAMERPEEQITLAHRIVSGHLSVRQAEALVSPSPKEPAPAKKAGRPQDRAYGDLIERLQKRLGTRVTLMKGRKGSRLVIHCFSADDLDRVSDVILG